MLRIVQLNTERSNHLARIRPFLEDTQPDVVCLQEFPEPHIAEFEKLLGAESVFIPMTQYTDGVVQGLCLFSRYPVKNKYVERYGGSTDEVPEFDDTSFESIHATVRFSLMACDIETEGEAYHIGTTHFPVTDRGEATDYQRTDMQALLALLRDQGELVFSGDFNAPRGGEIFSTLADRYTDNVPPKYKTSIDLDLHRAGKEHAERLSTKMVDGIFSTSGYRVSDVEMTCGVSDHCALVAKVEKSY